MKTVMDHFKTLRVFFWYGPRAAAVLQEVCMAWEAAVSAYGVYWFALGGMVVYHQRYIYSVVVAVGLSLFGVSVARMK